jgi:predicted HicB family RNase H-like nuclease
VILLSNTSSKAKDKYNENAYSRYTLRIRKDSDLHDRIEIFMSKNGTSLNYLIIKLLSEHFEI